MHFVETIPQFKIIQSIPLNHIMAPETDTENIISRIQHYTNDLFVIPNYWVGNTIYQFQSNKRSLVEAFLARKLRMDFSGLPDIINFFDYKFSGEEKKERSIYVFFPQDTIVFGLYDKLKQWGLEPVNMTTPSFILESKVKNDIRDFSQGGKCLIHMLTHECLVYFYYQGNFLFDRVIELPEMDTEKMEMPGQDSLEPASFTPQDITNIVTYEINQSLFLFSQKTKSDIDDFYLLSSCNDEIERLRKTLDRDIEDLNKIISHDPDPDMEKSIGPLASFTPADISPSQGYLTISNKNLKNTIAWKPVKHTGIVIGVCLVILLSLESLFIYKWSRLNGIDRFKPDTQSRQTLSEYNKALDVLIREKSHPNPKQIIEKLIMSLPDNIILNEISIEFEKNPNLDFNGTITAATPAQVRSTLSQLVTGLNTYLTGKRPVTLEQINFKSLPQQLPGKEKKYLLAFSIDLK